MIETNASKAKENKEQVAMAQQGALAQQKMELEKITVTEGEKRKTERVKANNDFLKEIIMQSHAEQAAGGITDATHDRLRIAMNVAARVGDLSRVDLAAEVGRAEQMIAFAQQRNPQPNTMPVQNTV